jgi:hypothetical protein
VIQLVSTHTGAALHPMVKDPAGGDAGTGGLQAAVSSASLVSSAAILPDGGGTKAGIVETLGQDIVGQPQRAVSRQSSGSRKGRSSSPLADRTTESHRGP